jgi:hypothetical protein
MLIVHPVIRIDALLAGAAIAVRFVIAVDNAS